MVLRYGSILPVLLLLFLAGSVSMASAADTAPVMIASQESEPGTLNTSVSDLIEFVNEAVVYSQQVGKEKALLEFSRQNGSFTRGDLYIWAYDFDGINLAHPWHPEYHGTNKLDLTDISGFPMIAAMRDVAANGSGFVRYQYENPVSGQTEPKLAYVKRIDDSWWIGSGIYGPDLPLPSKTPESVRDMLKDRVDEAIRYTDEHGSDQALSAFNNQTGPFITNETYIFAFDMNGTTLAHPFHPDRIGVNESALTDINGASIGHEKLAIAAEGGGFLYYVFNNPDAGDEPQFKISYVRPADTSLVLGTGIYLPDIPASFPTERRDELIVTVRKAISYIHEHGKEAAIREFNDPNGTFSDPEMFVFAFDTDGTLLANPYLPGLVGKDRTKDMDPYGKYPVQQLIRDAKAGGGFSYYFFADPGSDYAIRLKLAYTDLADDTLVVGAGIFPDNV